ncbi:MAG TPA: CNNM domain-containing protein [Candidatus Saccharimonadaceae bacterium]|nr:CNNM domain-containing protein [Candidatus Saccharimonadaceae bacterium]
MQYIELVVLVVVLVGLSAIFSGLNIAFMSLPLRDLKHKARLGNTDAKRVLPLREKSHLTLASILFANIGAVTATGLVIEGYTGGIIAGFASTILLVIFGEILPQAYFTRAALRMCSIFVPFLKLTIIVTYILAKPTQLLLDKTLPRVEHPLRTRGELGLLIHEYEVADSSELDDDEVEIIQGALQLSEKRVGEIMEPIRDVFWLPSDAVLDEPTVDTIKSRGYSRVPVFDRALTECYGVLLMKDMVDIDFDDEPRPIIDFMLHGTELVGSRTALDTMLRKFLALPSHLVPIEKDDQIVGILTMEDLVEEIVGHEIADETDRALARE